MRPWLNAVVASVRAMFSARAFPIASGSAIRKASITCLTVAPSCSPLSRMVRTP